jgi:RNA polymerase sigma factor (TIGR02999 family)
MNAYHLPTRLFTSSIRMERQLPRYANAYIGASQPETLPVNAIDTAPAGALNPMFQEVYQRLKAMASRERVRGGSPTTLCTTELVHEAYMKMSGGGFQGTHAAQFFAFAAQAMRHILIDAARRRAQPKRGGDQIRITLEDPSLESVHVDPELALRLDQALLALAREHARAAHIVELHFFAGLDLQQVAQTLGVAIRTVNRDWRYARLFLAAHS